MIDKDKYTTYTLFGKEASRRYDERGIDALIEDDTLFYDVKVHHFSTESERQAYYMGIDDSQGWKAYTEIKQSDYIKVKGLKAKSDYDKSRKKSE